jgi:hypothetical protein
MASPTGGRFIFQAPDGFAGVTLGINNGVAPVFPEPVEGNFNVEVFTAAGVSGTPTLDPGFQDFAIDFNGTLGTDPVGFLTGHVLTLGSGNLTVADSVTGAATQTAASIVGGSGNQHIVGAGGDVLIGGSGNQILNAIQQEAGTQTLIGGSGQTTVYAGAGDVVTGASGNGQTYVDGTFGNVQIRVGSGTGTDLIVGSLGNSVSGAAGPDTITGGSNAVTIQGLGGGDLVDFTNQTGNAAINALVGGVAVTLGGGAASVFGGAGDTVIGGSGAQYVDGGAGTMRIQVGSAGTEDLFGSSVAGGNDTILGGAAAVTINAQTGGSGDLIDLSGSSGSARISSVIDGADTIIAGNGSTRVFGGDGDRIGVGGGATGTDIRFDHTTTVVGASLGFGTNSSVAGSTADVTVGAASGGAAVSGFDQANDFVFYQNENAADTAAIVASAIDTTIGGVASVVFDLPDGTTMTLVGVTDAQFTAAGGFIAP